MDVLSAEPTTIYEKQKSIFIKKLLAQCVIVTNLINEIPTGISESIFDENYPPDEIKKEVVSESEPPEKEVRAIDEDNIEQYEKLNQKALINARMRMNKVEWLISQAAPNKINGITTDILIYDKTLHENMLLNSSKSISKIL
jgi:hypothetical protein